MNALFWQRMHGGSTHFPIVLLMASVVFDSVASALRDLSARRAIHTAGHYCAVAGVLGGCGAVVSGLAMTDGRLLGSGVERLHHLFIWPAFGLAVALVGWRFSWRTTFRPRVLRGYLIGMGIASALMMGAGYWGGEMLLGEEAKSNPSFLSAGNEQALITRGHELFLMNCAHCHGEDALGTEEGPNLAVRRRSGARIGSVIHNGIKGQMPRFDQKLGPDDVEGLIHFLRSLKVD